MSTIISRKLRYGGRTPPTQFFVDGCYARLLLLYTHRGFSTTTQGQSTCWRSRSLILERIWRKYQEISRPSWRASETLTVNTIGMLVYLYLCMDVRKAILYFDPRVFVLVRLSTPSQIALKRILWFIDQYPYHLRYCIDYRFEFFCGCR